MGLGEELRSIVVSKNRKIDLIADSFTKAEVNAVHKYVEQVLWADNLFKEMTAGRTSWRSQDRDGTFPRWYWSVMEQSHLVKLAIPIGEFSKCVQFVDLQRIKLE